MNQKHKDAADAIIAILMERGGFDEWWGPISEEDSDDILNCLAQKMSELYQEECEKAWMYDEVSK